MSVAIRMNQYQPENYQAGRAFEGNEPKENHKSIDGSSLSRIGDTKSQIEARKESARQKAMKLIGDAWARESNLAKGIQDMEAEKTASVSEERALRDRVDEMRQLRDGLQEKYGVSADSAEQKDLELLEKYQNNVNGYAYDSFSEEEKARLRELQTTPLTDYQKDYLSLNGALKGLEAEADFEQKKREALTQSIQMGKSAQDKSQEMIKAQKAADQILEAAGDEIMGMLVKEGTDHVEEEQKEQQEKAEEAKEAKEERTEQIEKIKEERKDEKELIEGEAELHKLQAGAVTQKQSVSQIAEVQKVIQKMIAENNLINEDLKGIKIDLNF